MYLKCVSLRKEYQNIAHFKRVILIAHLSHVLRAYFCLKPGANFNLNKDPIGKCLITKCRKKLRLQCIITTLIGIPSRL